MRRSPRTSQKEEAARRVRFILFLKRHIFFVFTGITTIDKAAPTTAPVSAPFIKLFIFCLPWVYF